MSEEDQELDDAYSAFYSYAKNLGDENLDQISVAVGEIKSNQGYSQHELIGKGAVKAVYKCFDEKNKRYVALARPREGLSIDEYDNLIHEAWLTASLSHPHIIRVYDVDLDDDGHPYFSMDLKSGQTLKGRNIKEDGERVLLALFLKVCEAMRYAHQQGVLHLDLKPENIQCDETGGVLVCDWGLGEYMQEHDGEGDHLRGYTQLKSTEGLMRGTPGYMAPEQILPHRTKDERTDIFGLGALLYYLLVGEKPFTGSVDDILNDTLSMERSAVRAGLMQAGVPYSLRQIVQKTLSTDRGERYGKVEHLSAEIERYQKGYPTLAEEAGGLRMLKLACIRHRVALILLLFLIAASCAVYTIYGRALSLQEATIMASEERVQAVEKDYLVLDSEYSQFRLDAKSRQYEAMKTVRNVGINAIHGVFSQDTKPKGHSRHNPGQLRRSFIDGKDVLYAVNLLKPHESGHPYEYWVYANFFLMDFQNIAHSDIESKSPQVLAMKRLAKQYRHVSQASRPTVNDFRTLFKSACDDPDMLPMHLEALYRCDWSVRKRMEGHNATTLLLLQKMNDRYQSFSAQQNGDRIIIKSNEPSLFLGSKVSRDFSSVLSFINAPDLQVLTPQCSFDLALLNESVFEKVDLSEVNRVYSSKPLQAPQLRQILINPRDLAPVRKALALPESVTHPECIITTK